MTEVIIFGYFGKGNIGDETNLRELINLLRHPRPELKLTVITADPEQTGREFGVGTVGKYDFLEIDRLFRRAGFLIGCGGSLLQNRTSRRSLLYYTSLLFLAKWRGLKIFLHGQGIGPVRGGIEKLIAGRALSGVDCLTVRDRLSVIALAELNVTGPEIHFTAEPLLTLDRVSEETVDRFWAGRASVKPCKVGLILRENSEISWKYWRPALKMLVLTAKIEPYLLAIANRDLKFTLALASEYKIAGLELWRDWEELQAAVGGLNFLFSCRLHGLVAAVDQEIPCCGLAIDPKIDGFCRQWGVPFFLISPETDQITLANRILNSLEPKKDRPVWLRQRNYQRARAMENQIVLKRFLERQ